MQLLSAVNLRWPGEAAVHATRSAFESNSVEAATVGCHKCLQLHQSPGSSSGYSTAIVQNQLMDGEIILSQEGTLKATLSL